MRGSAASLSIPSRSAPSAKMRVEIRSDRKSTRLNSSHVSISYADFCLKKKTDDAEEFDLVADAMDLERGQDDSALGEIRQPGLETIARIDPLDIRVDGRMNNPALQPHA